MLYELRAGSQQDTAECFGAGFGLADEEIAPAYCILPLVLDREDDLLLMGEDEWIVRRSGMEVRENLRGLLLLVVGNQRER